MSESEKRGDDNCEMLGTILRKLEDIEKTYRMLLSKNAATKDGYSTAEVAAMVGKTPVTVQDWCRLGRIECRRRESGPGRNKPWEVTAEGLAFYQAHGLLPPK